MGQMNSADEGFPLWLRAVLDSTGKMHAISRSRKKQGQSCLIGGLELFELSR
jgi:hypothetical protein